MAAFMNAKQIVTFIHDIKQPLYVQGLLTYQLRELAGTPELHDLVNDLSTTNLQIKAMLHQLGTWVAPDADKPTPRPQPISVSDLFESVQGELPDAFYFMNNRYIVSSDPGMLRQIILQFALNAIKHAPMAQWTAGCRRRAGGLRIDVIDDGPGIASEVLDQGFRPFNPVLRPGACHSLGLGLPIAARYAELLGHRIEIVSSGKRGTRASVYVPLQTS